MIEKPSCTELKEFYKKAWNAISGNFKVMEEVKRAKNLKPTSTTAKDFLREYAWSVCVSGFKVEIVSNFFPGLERAFKGWDYEAILRDKEEVRAAALQVFGNRRKIDAVLKAATFIDKCRWDKVQANLLDGMITTSKGYILPSSNCIAWIKTAYEKRELPFMGEVTRRFFLKNLGFDLAKNDIWLTRLTEKYGPQLAQQFGYTPDANGVQRFVDDIAECVGERPSVVETVLWNARLTLYNEFKLRVEGR